VFHKFVFTLVEKITGICSAIGILLPVVLCSCVPAGDWFGRQDDTESKLLQRFISEAPLAWENSRSECLAFRKNADWRVGHEFDGYCPGAGGVNKDLKESSICQYAGLEYGKIVISRSSDFENEIACVYNPSYFALLTRQKGTSEWTASKLGKIPDRSDGKLLHERFAEIDWKLEILAKPLEGIRNPFEANPLLDGYSMEDGKTWATLRNREIQSIRVVSFDGAEMVEVVLGFVVKAMTGVAGNQAIFQDQSWQCVAIFDPKQEWCLRHVHGGKTNLAGESNFVHTIDYCYQDINSVQILVNRKECISKPGSESTTEKSWNSNISLAGNNRSDFTLTAFGLPEPDWYRPQRPWWFYLSVIGMTMVVGGAILFRYGNKVRRR